LVIDVERRESVEDASDVPIHVFTHGQGRAGMCDIFLCGIAGSHPEGAVFELIVKPVRNLHRRMRCVEGNVAEERAILAAPDEVNRMVREIVRDVSLSLNRLAVVFERRIEVCAPMPRAESVELLETAAVGMVRVLGAIVPLAEGAGAIAGRLESISNGFFVEAQALGARGYAVNPEAVVVASREEFGPSGRTERTHIEPVEHRSGSGQGIDPWGGEVRVSIDAEVAPTLVVGEDDDDIRPGRRGALNGEVVATEK